MIDDKLERFRTMVELAPVAIALFSGPQFIITEANERVLEYWGRNREEVMDKPLFEALPEASGQGFEELLHRVYTTGERFVARELTVTLKRKGRLEQTYIDFSYDPYREADDTITGIIVVCLEVTDQVVARQKVQRSEHRFRSLIENASIPTCLFVGRDLRIEVANEAMIAVWGKGSSVLGQPLAVALPELRAQHFLTTLDDLFTSGHAYESKGGRADLVVNGQLSTFYFNYSFIPLRDEEGQVYAIMETAVDVTERILAEQQLIASEARYRAIAQDREEQVKLRTSELEEANLALQRSNANLELFASAASHDLQEPLRKIQSFSLLLKATYQSLSDNERNDLIDRMDSAAGRMGVLIRDLLAYSRLSIHQVSPQNVAMNPLVDEVMRELDMVIYKAQAVIEVAPLGTIRGDGTQLMQLFRNLLSNALKFKKPGVPLHIKLDSVSVSREELPDTYQPGREHGQFCAIRIADNGIGFAQEKAAYIFGAFNRLHGRSQIPGTGLGLSIVQRVVDNHQGYIDAQSQPGQGATFSVYLPI